MSTPYDHWPADIPRPIPWPEVRALQRPQSAAEVDVLRESMKLDGVIRPPVLMPDGRTIDGHKRCELAAELGLPMPLPRVMPEGYSDERGLALARALQAGARNLTQEEWREGRAELEEFYLTLRRGGATQEEAAREAGITRSTGQKMEHRVHRITRRTPAQEDGESPAQEGGATNDHGNNGCTPSPDQEAAVPDKRRKLTSQEEQEVVEAVKAGESQTSVGKRFGLTRQAVGKIVSRSTAKKATPAPSRGRQKAPRAEAAPTETGEHLDGQEAPEEPMGEEEPLEKALRVWRSYIATGRAAREAFDGLPPSLNKDAHGVIKEAIQTNGIFEAKAGMHGVRGRA